MRTGVLPGGLLRAARPQVPQVRQDDPHPGRGDGHHRQDPGGRRRDG